MFVLAHQPRIALLCATLLALCLSIMATPPGNIDISRLPEPTEPVNWKQLLKGKVASADRVPLLVRGITPYYNKALKQANPGGKPPFNKKTAQCVAEVMNLKYVKSHLICSFRHMHISKQTDQLHSEGNFTVPRLENTAHGGI